LFVIPQGSAVVVVVVVDVVVAVAVAVAVAVVVVVAVAVAIAFAFVAAFLVCHPRRGSASVLALAVVIASRYPRL
jgi:hypothetical protein